MHIPCVAAGTAVCSWNHEANVVLSIVSQCQHAKVQVLGCSRTTANCNLRLCAQIEISKTYGQNEWHDDLRKVLKLAGEANKKVGGTRQA